MKKALGMAIKKNRLIYVVEDNEIYNKLIVELLKRNGFNKVVPFFNGKDFLGAIKEGKVPDIVILDYYLGDVTGNEIFGRLKHISKSVKSIFLTAHKDMDAAVDLIKLGAVDYIVKEDDPALRRLYREVLKASKMIEIDKRNLFVKNAMIITIIILIAIVVFVVIKNVFHLL